MPNNLQTGDVRCGRWKQITTTFTFFHIQLRFAYNKTHLSHLPSTVTRELGPRNVIWRAIHLHSGCWSPNVLWMPLYIYGVLKDPGRWKWLDWIGSGWRPLHQMLFDNVVLALWTKLWRSIEHLPQFKLTSFFGNRYNYDFNQCFVWLNLRVNV